MRVILGSQSPRRRELMRGLDYPFECITINADETYPHSLRGGDIPIYISRAKARAYASLLDSEDILITADTIVWLDNQMLGKPHSEDEAVRMLHLLSGKTHSVFTGVTFLKNNQYTSFVDETKVTFRTLTDDEIRYYVSQYHPLDKAGAYGVQEFIGYIGVERLEGSYFNVMGFPIDRVYRQLRRMLPQQTIPQQTMK